MKVYESIIEISMDPVFSKLQRRNDRLRDEIRDLLKNYPSSRYSQNEAVFESDQDALLHLLLRRIGWNGGDDASGVQGYVGSAANCAFSLLYGVFGIDLIAFLFDQEWIPEARISPFRPKLFLKRLSILERAAKKLKNGTNTPILLPQLAAHQKPGMGPRIKMFDEDRHRLLVEASLREFRDFGELGVRKQDANEKQVVRVKFYIPHGDLDPEILKFAKVTTQALTGPSHHKP